MVLQKTGKGEVYKILTACPVCVACAARKAAMLSVVPVQTTQSWGNPVRIVMDDQYGYRV